MVEKSKKTRISVTFTQPVMDGLAELVESGLYLDPQSAIREFVWDGFKKNGIDPYKIKT